VHEVAVVGSEHPRWGQTVVAVVVRAEGTEVTAEDIVGHCRTHLAGYKKPTRVLFMESLPRTASQKISRATVRDLVRDLGEDG
jgi:fatty-acyl-CoA synthase